MNKRIVSWFITLVLLAIPIIAWVERDALFDAWRLRNYTAPAEVARLADVTTMTSDARKLFYVYRPQLQDRAGFSSICSDGREQTIVLGCYIENRGIYLYDVPDARLAGVEEVTAAHELLHAAYDRLSSRERQKVDAWLIDAEKMITDERFKQTIENYRQKDPSVVPNELHSILASEIRNLPEDLENYYKRYFTNRLAVVEFAESYKQEFTAREEQVAVLEAQMASVKAEIDSLNASLQQQEAQLESGRRSLQQQRSSGDIEGYNASVPGYNQQVNAYNAAVNRQRGLVEQYNQLVGQRNELAVEENELIEALDSRPSIQTQ